jgi:hypothetical protein
MTESESENIPRIDKVGYLYETLGWINDGATFEEIREAQIEYRKGLDRENFVDKRSGASSVRQLLKRTNGETYWTNTRATVSELMRLGLVEPASTPSRKEQLEPHRGRRYQVTEEGAQFVALMMEQDFWLFQDPARNGRPAWPPPVLARGAYAVGPSRRRERADTRCARARHRPGASPGGTRAACDGGVEQARPHVEEP